MLRCTPAASTPSFGSSFDTGKIMKKWQCFMLLSIVTLCDASKTNITSQDVEIEKVLSRLNKTPVKSIKSPDGDIIDCVNIYQQPAFDNPLLKNHTIPKGPSYHPLKNLSAGSKIFNSTAHNIKPIPQLWHLNGRCPKGTIPIRRTTKEDLLRAGNIKRYGMKDPNSSPRNDNPNDHEYAIAFAQANKFYGAWGTLNVWRPQVQRNNEFSLSQIWLLGGSGRNLNSVEAGWTVHPTLYGDYNAKLFCYWTRDNYRDTGCYNVLCSGFIQTDSEVSLDAVIDPVSVYGRQDLQVELSVLIWKDPTQGHWYLQFNDRTYGYWPANLFTHLRDGASLAQWGGEVLNKKTQGKHTLTHMGSGHFSHEGFGGASYVKNMLVIDESNSLVRIPGHFQTQNMQPNCYDVQLGTSNYDWGDYIFFGGPGYSPRCP